MHTGAYVCVVFMCLHVYAYMHTGAHAYVEARSHHQVSLSRDIFLNLGERTGSLT